MFLNAGLFRQTLPEPIEDTLERLLALGRFEQLYREPGRIADNSSVVERFLRLLTAVPGKQHLSRLGLTV